MTTSPPADVPDCTVAEAPVSVPVVVLLLPEEPDVVELVDELEPVAPELPVLL